MNTNPREMTYFMFLIGLVPQSLVLIWRHVSKFFEVLEYRYSIQVINTCTLPPCLTSLEETY